MLVEKLGYVLSELPVLILILWSAWRIVHWRRARAGRRSFNEANRGTLASTAQYSPDDWEFYPRFALAVFAVAIIGALQVIFLAPLGAAIIAGVFILTSAAIVHGVLF